MTKVLHHGLFAMFTGINFECLKLKLNQHNYVNQKVNYNILKNILVAYLTGEVIVLKTLGRALLQLPHPGGLLQFL